MMSSRCTGRVGKPRVKILFRYSNNAVYSIYRARGGPILICAVSFGGFFQRNSGLSILKWQRCCANNVSGKLHSNC